MPNNYFDFLEQNSIPESKDSKGGSTDEGMVNLTVRADADCQVVCDGDFLFLLNANQIVKEKAPAGQHLIQFIALEDSDVIIEKIVDWPTPGKNYLEIVSGIKEKVVASIREKQEREKRSSKEFTLNGVSFKMIFIEGGDFMMGTDEPGRYDEAPAHRVSLDSFRIGETMVTQELWKAVMGNNPSHFKGDDKPVENISWDDCQAFISKLNVMTGERFRLPTEAEWEFAARGGRFSNGFKYSGSNNIDTVAWFNCETTHSVKGKLPNELGLYDMSGNVLEWCKDCYAVDYYASRNEWQNPQGPEIGEKRVARGSCYCDFLPDVDTITHRTSYEPDFKESWIGIRLAQ